MTLSLEQCTSLICRVYEQFVPPGEHSPAITSETRLFGAGASLDSSALVSFIVELEQQFAEEAGADIVLADDRAMSQKSSPFRSIGTLAEYVARLLSERRESN